MKNKNKGFVKLKNILKKERPTISIKEREVTNIFNEPSRFFKREMEETKMSIFG
jgi:hypothetical protein